MDATRDYHTKRSHKERQIPRDIIYKWNLKYDTNEPIYKTETDSYTQKSECCCQGVRREIDREFGVGICKQLHLEGINSKLLLYVTGDYV